MARRPDPVRIDAARRAATVARLVSTGRSPADATAVIEAWEAALRDRPPTAADWEGFEAWLDARRRLGRGPPR